MPNKNYQKGARKERKIVNAAREEGKIAFRSAGSHSIVDVCVIDMKNRKILFIQSKSKRLSAKEKEEYKELEKMTGTFEVEGLLYE